MNQEEKKIKDILKVLYDLKNGDEFYFNTYGTDLLEGLVDSVKEECAKILNKVHNKYENEFHGGYDNEETLTQRQIAVNDCQKAIRDSK